MRWGDLGVVIGLLLGAPSRVTRSAGELYQRFVAAVARIAKNRPDIDDVAIDLTGSDALEGGWGYTVSAGDVCQLFDRLD
ncbi:MAG: hypothetical protein NT039_03800, partial [Candidatus Berkelbacteria bacterium]|nr:hypothetical protein [Candidatus Berkelbacteria bacterium]